MILTLHGLVPLVRNQPLFRPISMSLLSGSCIIFTGNNGIGKTTLLKTIANISPIREGQILCNEIDIQLAREEYHSLICYINDVLTLDQKLTVIENLKFWAAIARRESLILATLSFWNLEAFVDYKIEDLSSGFQRRVQLARLMLSNSMIWILDEPFAHLDDLAAIKLGSLISTKCKNGGIVCVAEHRLHSYLEEVILYPLQVVEENR